MYISLEVVNVWHHVILCACLRCIWITVQAGTAEKKIMSHLSLTVQTPIFSV
jgi:hypothetical protein